MVTWPTEDIQEQLHIPKIHSLFEFRPPYQYDFIGETHNFWEFVYVICGSISATADNHIYNLEPGDIIFHKPLEFHKLQVISEGRASLLISPFSLEGASADVFKDKIFKLTEDQQKIMQSLLDYLRTAAYTVYDDERCLWDFLPNFSKIPTFGQMVITYYYQLMLSLIAAGCTGCESITPQTIIFQNAVNYMNSQVTRQPSVDEIAEYCAVSKAGLERIFKKHTGLGIHKYFVILRLNTAAELLREGRSVTEVAEKLGFSSQAYFSSAYKREFGIWPTEQGD